MFLALLWTIHQCIYYILSISEGKKSCDMNLTLIKTEVMVLKIQLCHHTGIFF